MYLVINKFVTAVKVSNFSGHYLHNRSILDIDVLGYIDILYHKEHPPEVWHIPPGTPCISGIKVLNYLPQSLKIPANDEDSFKSTLKKFLNHHSFYSMHEYYHIYTDSFVKYPTKGESNDVSDL
jgi:hypothetical protein